MSRFKPSLLSTMVAITLFTFSQFTFADEFSDVYGNFQTALAKNQYREALALAKKSYHLGVDKVW